MKFFFIYIKCKGCKKGMLNFLKENMLDICKYLIFSLIFFFKEWIIFFI